MWEPYEVKAQTIKTAIESATLLLRIDDIVSGIQKKNKMAPGQSSAPQPEDPDQVRKPEKGIALCAERSSASWYSQWPSMLCRRLSMHTNVAETALTPTRPSHFVSVQGGMCVALAIGTDAL